MQRAEDLDFPHSVLDFMEGLMGQPYGGFPEPLRTKAPHLPKFKLIGRFSVDDDRS
jgi:pyruvate carboxylase